MADGRWRFQTKMGLLLASIFAGILGGLRFFFRSAGTVGPTSNAILVIAPYWHSGTWVFDDPRTGLYREPFVAGVPEMIDLLVADIPDAKTGFRLLFSASPFPGHQKKLDWVRGESGGNYYRLDDPPMEGWLCPAMFHYFSAPPPTIYVKAERISRQAPGEK